MHQSSPSAERLLSILIQGRNDNYMGNFTWRLSQALNRHAENLVILGIEEQVEILVSDWGSETPLHQVLELTEHAKRLVKFLMVPPSIAKEFDRDAGYSNVHPINSVARRATGKFVMFSDSDVFIPLASMAKLMFHLRRGMVDNLSLDEHFFWASKFHVPTDIVRQNLPFDEICQRIDANWKEFHYDPVDKVNFRGGGVCLLVKRDIWFAASGWDERLIYWGWFDIDLHRRLKSTLRWDLLELHDVRIFHFEHYTNRADQQSQQKECKLKVNPQVDPAAFAPNPPNWGLIDYSLQIVDGWGLPRADAPNERSGLPRDILKGRLRTAPPPVASLPAGKLFEFLVSELKPQRWCIVSADNSSLRIWDVVKRFSPKSMCVVDLWSRESLSASLRREIPTAFQDSLAELFIAQLEHQQFADRTRICRAAISEAQQRLQQGEERFDLIWFVDELENEGVRSDVLNWLNLLTPQGMVLGSCSPLYTAIYKVQTLSDLGMQARGLSRVDLPEFWGFYPSQIFAKVEALIDREYRTNEKVAALIEKIDRCYRQHYLERGMEIPQL